MFTKKDSRWQGNIFCWLFLHCKALRRLLLQHSKLRLQYKVHLGPPDAAIWSNVGNVEATVQNYLTLRNSKTKHALLHVVSCHFVLCPYVCTVYVYVYVCVCVCVCVCLCSVNVDCTAGADYCPQCTSLLPPIHNSDTSSFLSVNYFCLCLLCLFVPPLLAIRCIRFSACAVTQVLCWIHFPSISEAGTRAHFTAANDKQTNDSSSLFRMDHLSCTRMIKIS